MSLPKKLADGVSSTIVSRLSLEEVQGPEGGPLLPLKSAMSPVPVGALRVFRGQCKVVAVSLVVPQIGLDSHMVFAFTAKDSAVPHFTVDSVKGADFFAFHLDLIPRADLGAELAYMNATLLPLTEAFQQANAIEGLTPAHLSPRQRALMSPWMLAHRATETAFGKIDTVVSAYLEHWFALLSRGVSPELSPPASVLAERDKKNRAALFNPETDPVWLQVDRLLGAETSAKIQNMLKAQD